MSTTYAGLPGNEVVPSTLTVSGATNATPIVVTTTANHGLVTGERVHIYGAQGNVAANGIFYASVTSNTQFAIYTGWSAGAVSGAVAGTGAWTSGGTVQPLGLSNLVTLPADGVDGMTAASVNVPLEGQVDRASWLSERTSRYRLAQMYIYGNLPNANPQNPITGWSARTAGNTIWGDDVNLTTLGGIVLDVVNGDYVEATLATSGHSTSAGANANVCIRLAAVFHEYGVAAGSPSTVGGGGVQLAPSGITYAAPCSTQGLWLANIGTAHGMNASIFSQAYGGGAGATYDMVGDWTVICKVWRPR